MNSRRKLLRSAFAAVAIAALGSVARAQDGSSVPRPPAPRPAPAAPAVGAERTEWRVGDELEVRVLGRADLSARVRVLADGTVDVPFAGRFRIMGRTIDELKKDVEAGFASQERTPQVAISIGALAPESFYVLGEAGKAGAYSVPRPKTVTLLQAIGMAGGFGPEADFTRVQVIPAAGGPPRIVDASPGRVSELASIRVSDGDTIVIPSVGRIYLMGQLNRTGGFAPPPGERMTLTRAIALAGGFTRLADQSAVLVSWRGPSGEAQSNRYNVKAILAGGAEDIVVQPGNLIYVNERLF